MTFTEDFFLYVYKLVYNYFGLRNHEGAYCQINNLSNFKLSYL